MRAIILAAGQGTRLRPLTRDKPKCLVPYAGQPIIEHVLATMRECGIQDINLVTGYRADQLEYLGLPTFHNEHFASTNMVYSLFCAERVLDDDVIVSYADIVYAPRVLESLLASTSDFSVVVDRDWLELWKLRMSDPLADAETMRVDMNGHITELGKKPTSYSDIQGQYIGLFKLSAAAAVAIREHYAAMDRSARYDGKDFDTMYMTSFIQHVIDELMPAAAVYISGGWIEIDRVEDLRLYDEKSAEIERRLRS